MTELATRPNVSPRVQPEEVPVTTAPAQPPTLITEQQVLIGSAAALTSPRVRRNLRSTVRSLFVRAETTEGPARRRRYPKHYDFIEDAAMSRMMDRL
ncbi:hypothetical protein [Mycolicibacterium psychrotolerans]|uniref:Uncharacterized protein n=1 Tax=Mycolicibacterium psychrotolerans TaxID=216929 RepID=A0A7I7MJV5_9MYCO|nr:hypothetical protein [Mycolicibacterium psychrotolerans]BBX66552.1 hypothetical protein MPSYJ_00130 [Mycolicibacterium psychrotolerans]BBX72090.1 hypothetical protein MPSYJ_55510 [Mycolicibacterium psychrotolerans]